MSVVEDQLTSGYDTLGVYSNLTILDFHDLDAKPEVKPVNEHGAIMYAGRWGIHGVSLPGRATFSPGNVGWVTFGAPRPQQVHILINMFA